MTKIRPYKWRQAYDLRAQGLTWREISEILNTPKPEAGIKARAKKAGLPWPPIPKETQKYIHARAAAYRSYQRGYKDPRELDREYPEWRKVFGVEP